MMVLILLAVMKMMVIVVVWSVNSGPGGSSAQMKTMATSPCAQSAQWHWWWWWWWWSLGWWQSCTWSQGIYSNDNNDHGKCGDTLMKTACRNSRGLNGASVCDATASYCSAKEVSAWDCSVTQFISTRGGVDDVPLCIVQPLREHENGWQGGQSVFLGESGRCTWSSSRSSWETWVQNIPDICHRHHRHVCVNFFWTV